MRESKHNTDSASAVRLPKCQALEIVRESAHLRDLFWAKVDRRDEEVCWLWRGNRVGGNHSLSPYGQWAPTVAPRQQVHLYAHQTSWALSHGSAPDGYSVLHRCDMPLCCNPSHLFLGTQLDNMRDAAEKGRLHVSRPKRQKLLPGQLSEIDALIASGAKQVDAARRFGVSKAFISLYLKGKRRQYDAPSRRRRAA